jgi:hypothetical protein
VEWGGWPFAKIHSPLISIRSASLVGGGGTGAIVDLVGGELLGMGFGESSSYAIAETADDQSTGHFTLETRAGLWRLEAALDRER